MCNSIKLSNQNLIEEFQAQTKLVEDEGKDLRHQLQVLVLSIQTIRTTVQVQEHERARLSSECAKTSLYYRLIREFLVVF